MSDRPRGSAERPEHDGAARDPRAIDAVNPGLINIAADIGYDYESGDEQLPPLVEDFDEEIDENGPD